jgi:signal peptidase II
VRSRRHGSESSTRPGDSVSAEPAGARPAAHRYLPLALVAAALWLLLDQLTKWWATSTLDDEIIEVAWTLRFRLVTNTGASFSIGEGLGPVIGVVALVVVGILLWTGRSIGSPLGAIGLGLVLGGALGNILDRAVRAGDGFFGGAVIDFIDFQWWPVFNVADIGVVVGAVLLLVASMLEPVGDDEPEDESSDAGDPVAGERLVAKDDEVDAGADADSDDRPDGGADARAHDAPTAASGG